MKRDISIMRGGLAAALSVAAVACSPGLEEVADLQVRPVAEQGAANISRETVFYEQAVTAINRRDYATALDYLQAARAGDPNNVRVLNAFGVVYDKLGRFDLSSRYYAQANAVDPGSKTVARNVAYSLMLQGLTGPQVATAPQPPAAERVALGPPPVAAPVTPVEVQLLQPAVFSPASAVEATPAALEAALPNVVAPDRIEPLHQSEGLSFASVDIDLPEDPSVGAFPAIEPIAAPKALSSETLQVAFEEPAPAQPAFAGPSTPPALQPLALEPAALALGESIPSMPRVLPSVSPANLTFTNVAFALSDAAPSFEVDEVRLSASERPSAKPLPLPAALRMVAVDFDTTPQIVPAVFHVPAPVAQMQPTRVSFAPPATATRPVATSPARVARKPLLIGRPLRIVNASGRHGATERVHHSLTALGWSISKLRPVSASSLRVTTLVYPMVNEPVAKALARTLPFRVRLQPDPCGCHGVQLHIGSDFLSWKATGRYVPSVWRTSLDVAALKTNKGVQ